MFAFFKSSWFVGIVTGLISGLLVYAITNWIMKKRGKEEYYRRVSDANRDVITSLKPYISEKGLPDAEIFKAIISSTARTCSVETKDMYSISVFCEELIREIIGDVYVSSDKKKEYADELISYKKHLQEMLALGDNEVKYIKENDSFRRKMPLYIALLCAMFSMLISLMGLMLTNEASFWYPFDSEPMLWVPIMTVMIMLVASTATLDRLLKIKRRRNDSRRVFEESKNRYYDALNKHKNNSNNNSNFE